ncbi:hypothetical protein M885DRAFT_547629 [Pelagophyceae sp. CCMP2097]|nr:hypothetical protein M885DRAFT_547629 [Pelagophyceae sp. CCMP2097]
MCSSASPASQSAEVKHGRESAVHLRSSSSASGGRLRLAACSRLWKSHNISAHSLAMTSSAPNLSRYVAAGTFRGLEGPNGALREASDAPEPYNLESSSESSESLSSGESASARRRAEKRPSFWCRCSIATCGEMSRRSWRAPPSLAVARARARLRGAVAGSEAALTPCGG